MLSIRLALELSHFLCHPSVETKVNYCANLATLMKKLILLTELAYLSTRLRINSAEALVNCLGSIDDVHRQDAGLANEQADIDTKDWLEYSEAPGSVDSLSDLLIHFSLGSPSSGGVVRPFLLFRWCEEMKRNLIV
jgi:hypothetical protein